MGSGMHQGDPMMGRPDQCQVMTDRDRGFGFWSACNR